MRWDYVQEQWVDKDLEGDRRSRETLEGTSVRSRGAPCVSWMQVWEVTATPSCLVWFVKGGNGGDSEPH